MSADLIDAQMPRSKSTSMLPLTIIPPERAFSSLFTEAPLEPPKVKLFFNYYYIFVVEFL
jgi:hypothetical protein